MAVVIRKVDRRPLWDKKAPPAEPWLRADDLAADALQDLRTSQNRLSVYILDSLESADLNRLLAAMAASRDVLDKLDYAALDIEFISKLGIKMEAVPGETPDQEANKWHRDLTELTASKLSSLGLVIRQHGTVARKYPKDIKELIKEAIRHNQIDRTRLKANLVSKLT